MKHICSILIFKTKKTIKKNRLDYSNRLAAESGFEPEQNESESLVLPLHYSASLLTGYIIPCFKKKVKPFFEIFSKNFLIQNGAS